MGVRIIHDDERDYCALYCSTTMHAFGPVIRGDMDDAEAFLEWLGVDARVYDDHDLEQRYSDWIMAREKAGA